MRREQEQVNKQGCPKCGSSNVEFQREVQGKVNNTNAERVIRRTVGFCKDCGHTWYTDSDTFTTQATEIVKKTNPLVWWILGWIFFFPAPVMVLIWRKKNTWKVWLKVLITVVFWVLFFVIGSLGENGSSNNSVDGTAAKYQVRVVSVENTKEFGSGSIGHFTTQNNYVCILVELKNNSNYTHRFSYNDFEIVSGTNKYDSKGTEASWYSKYKGDDYPALYLNGSIDGGLSGKYYLVFETAQSTANESYQLVYSYGFETITIDLK